MIIVVVIIIIIILIIKIIIPTIIMKKEMVYKLNTKVDYRHPHTRLEPKLPTRTQPSPVCTAGYKYIGIQPDINIFEYSRI